MAEIDNLSNLQGLDYYWSNTAIATADNILNLQFGDISQTCGSDVLKLIENAKTSDGTTVDEYIAGLVSQIDVQKLIDACNSVGDSPTSLCIVSHAATAQTPARKRKLSEVYDDHIPLPDAKRFKRSTLTVHKLLPQKYGRKWRRVDGNRKLRQLLINRTCRRLSDERLVESQPCCDDFCWAHWKSFAYKSIYWPVYCVR